MLDVTEVLGKVPPHLLGEQIVAEAQRLAGVRSVALYLIDIDGTRCTATPAPRSSPTSDNHLQDDATIVALQPISAV